MSWATVVRLLARYQRLAVSLLLGAAAVLALEVLRPAPPALLHVVVAARDLPAGVTLAPGDLRTVGLPPNAVPDGALRLAEAVVGRLTAGPLRRGETVTDVRLVGPGLLDRLGDGLVAAPVRITDATALTLVRPGDRVDVLAVAAEPASVSSAVRVAVGVVVLAVPQHAEDALAESALLVVAVDDSTARALAVAAARSRLSVVVRPPATAVPHAEGHGRRGGGVDLGRRAPGP